MSLRVTAPGAALGEAGSTRRWCEYAYMCVCVWREIRVDLTLVFLTLHAPFLSLFSFTVYTCVRVFVRFVLWISLASLRSLFFSLLPSSSLFCVALPLICTLTGDPVPVRLLLPPQHLSLSLSPPHEKRNVPSRVLPTVSASRSGMGGTLPYGRIPVFSFFLTVSEDV